MWRASETDELIKRYDDCGLVDEIVIIDNDTSAKNVDLTKYDKVVHIEEPENTFVNPAWNKGVSICKNEDIIISNDDILFDVNKYLDVVSNSNISYDLIGLWRGSFKRLRRRFGFTDKSIKKGHSVGYGWGCLFFCKKSTWKPIPEEYKIYAGDTWMMQEYKDIYEIHIDIDGTWGTTSMSKDLYPIAVDDAKRFRS